MMISGIPNGLNVWLKWSSAASSAVNPLLQGIKTTPSRRPWSTMNIMQPQPFSISGNPDIKFWVIIWNGFIALDLIGCVGSCVGCVLTLFHWQVAQPAMYSYMKWHNLGHQLCLCTISRVVPLPGCPVISDLENYPLEEGIENTWKT